MIGYLLIVLVIDLFVLTILIKDLVQQTAIRKNNLLACFLLFIALWTLYFTPQIENGISPFTAFLDALTAVRDILIFKYNYQIIQNIFVNYSLMPVVYILTLLLTYYSLGSFILGLFGRKLWMNFVVSRLRHKPITVVIGESEALDAFLKDKPKNTILWAEKGRFSKIPIYQKPVNVEGFKHLSKYKNVHFIVFKSGDSSLETANYFLESLSENDLNFANIFLTIVIDQNYSQVYDTIIEKGGGLIKVVNQSELIAQEVIKKYPLSKFLDKRFVEDNGIIKDECNIQAVFIGCGPVNEKLYLSTVMNSQFATVRDGKLAPKVVNYHIIEQKDTKLSPTLFRIDNTKFDPLNYFPLPEPTHHTRYLQLELSGAEFDSEFLKIARTPNSKTFVFIAIGADSDNLDFVLKLHKQLQVFELKDVVLFVQIRDLSKIKHLFAEEIVQKDIIFYGSSTDYVHEEIIFGQKLETAASGTANHYEQSKSGKEAAPIKPRNNWRLLDVYRQESNRYAVLNINFKLNLLGFAIFDETLPKTDLTSFYARYDADNERNNKERLNYDFSEPFKARDVMAYIEHLRWNAFHIAHDFIPLPKQLVTLENNKEFYLKEHGCLTTFDGLKDYQSHLIMQIEDPSLTDSEKFLKIDIIKYDYNTLDELAASLAALGVDLHKKD